MSVQGGGGLGQDSHQIGSAADLDFFLSCGGTRMETLTFPEIPCAIESLGLQRLWVIFLAIKNTRLATKLKSARWR
jgi:hypothetical protein